MALTRLRRHLRLLKALSSVPAKRRKQLLSKTGKDGIHCISECAHNVLCKNIKVNQSQKKKLLKHAKIIRLVGAKNKLNWKAKRKLLSSPQTGGFLPALLVPILASVAGGLLGDLVGGITGHR